MKKPIKESLLIVMLLSATNVVIADELMIFPAKGQSAETQDKDKYTCYGWAKGQTGFDPMQAPTTTTAPPKSKEGSVAGTAVVGAVGGAVLGGILGGKKSAKRGALAGGLVGGVGQSAKNSKSEKKQKKWEQQEVDNYANNRSKYNRAYSACLEGKGYTVK